MKNSPAAMTDAERQEVVAQAMARITVRVEQMDPKALKLLEDNARYMRHETFQQLVDNMRRDGVCTSVPFAWYNRARGGYEVLSGNHRTKAAIQAGITTIHVMLTDDELSKDERLAIQLSHNAITGEDDPATLKRLYESIESVDLRLYAGLDDAHLHMIDQVQTGTISEAKLKYLHVSFVFLPEEFDQVAAAFEEARAAVTGKEVWLGSLAQYDRFLTALMQTGDAHHVRNQTAALQLLLAVFARHRHELAEGWLDVAEQPDPPQYWLPLVSVFGTDEVPLALAKDLQKIVERLLAEKKIESLHRWRALEHLVSAWKEQQQRG